MGQDLEGRPYEEDDVVNNLINAAGFTSGLGDPRYAYAVAVIKALRRSVVNGGDPIEQMEKFAKYNQSLADGQEAAALAATTMIHDLIRDVKEGRAT